MAISIDAVMLRGKSWVEETHFANQLLRQGIRLLQTTPGGDAPADLPPGSLILPLTPAYDAALTEPVELGPINAQANAAGIELIPIDPSSPVIARPLRLIRVGLYGGGGAPFNHAGVLGESGFPLRFLNDAQIRSGELATVDVLVMPGGGFRAMHGQLEPLGVEGARILTQWVRQGGMYIGSCAGAYDCAIASEQFTATCAPKGELQLINARVWNEENGAESELEGLDSPGVGVLRLRTTRPDHPVMFGMPESFEVVHYNGPVFDVLESPIIEGASLAEGLAAFDGASEQFTAAEQFMGESAGESTLLERASAAGKHSVVAGELGTGRVVAFGSHPEFGFNLAMNEWGAPARMLVNAALWQSSHGVPAGARAWSYASEPGSVAVPRGSSLNLAQHHASELVSIAAALRSRSVNPPPAWLSSEYAMSVFGLSPEAIWRQSVDDIEALANDVLIMAASLSVAASALGTSDAERDAALLIDRWLLDERPAAWRQDGGYAGVVPLLRTAHAMSAAALDQWTIELGPPAGAYGYFQENPYHLVAGSYLAAVGCVSGAVQLLRALTAEVELVTRIARPSLIPV